MNNQECELVLAHLAENYPRMYHAPVAKFAYHYIVPGAGYEHCLWDWDTYFASVAIAKIMQLTDAPPAMREQMYSAMRGCILNFLNFQLPNGAMPYCVYLGAEGNFAESITKYDEPNQHKPVFAQFVHFICEETGDYDWILDRLPDIDRFLAHYDECYHDDRTGLYYWRTGAVIGVDNDPCTFGRPRNSSGSLYLNCLFVKEFAAIAALHAAAGNTDMAATYLEKREALIAAMQRYCWDKRDRFFYSVDLQCETERDIPWLNSGLGAFWHCLPLRIRLWTGFMPLWAGIATPEQARELVELHLNDTEALGCDYGIRTLAANEPMYNLEASSNPSNWLGPVWMIPNYLVFQGLLEYGFIEEALAFCDKVVHLLARDIAVNGAMHEYYVPETGQGIINCGFMNWNYLIANMIAQARDLAAVPA